MGSHRYYQHAEIPHPHPGPPREGEGDFAWLNSVANQDKGKERAIALEGLRQKLRAAGQVRSPCRRQRLVRLERSGFRNIRKYQVPTFTW